MLIAFEGLDQSGKETQARHLRARLEQDGRNVRALSFPTTRRPLGWRSERRWPASATSVPKSCSCSTLRTVRVQAAARSWLAAGDVVVCDRYRASSVAYGEAQGLDAAWLEDIQRDLPPATVTVLLDIAPETAVARKQSGRDRYERDLGLLARVRESYLAPGARRAGSSSTRSSRVRPWRQRSRRPSCHGSRDRQRPDAADPRLEQHRAARIERRARRHHVVDQDDSSAAEGGRVVVCWPHHERRLLGAKAPTMRWRRSAVRVDWGGPARTRLRIRQTGHPKCTDKSSA